MYTLPQEIEVWYIIPAIRKELSKCFINEHKLSYESTGKLLGLTKVAIFQYVKNKRASKVKLHPKIKKEIIRSSDEIIKNRSNSVKEILRIIKIIRLKKLHCEVCGNIVDNELHDCEQIIPKYEDI